MQELGASGQGTLQTAWRHVDWPSRFDPHSLAIRAERTAKMIEGRRLWLAMLKAEGKKAPCGRKPKGFVADPIFKKPLARLTKVQQMQVLDRKVRKADYKRLIYPAK